MSAKLFANDATEAQRLSDAINGSRMLRDAILRAKGYLPPQHDPVPTAPVFKKRKVVLKGRKKRGRKPSRHSPKVEIIKALVAAHFELSIDDLGARNKSYERAHPRQIAMYISRKATTVSFPRLGKQFGGFDHTTVVHAVQQVEKRIANNDAETIKAIHAVHKVIGA